MSSTNLPTKAAHYRSPTAKVQFTLGLSAASALPNTQGSPDPDSTEISTKEPVNRGRKKLQVPPPAAPRLSYSFRETEYFAAALKKIKAGVKPGHPPSDFCRFSEIRRVQLKEAVPRWTQATRFKYISKEWRRMSDAQKQPFKAVSSLDYEAYRFVSRLWDSIQSRQDVDQAQGGVADTPLDEWLADSLKEGLAPSSLPIPNKPGSVVPPAQGQQGQPPDRLPIQPESKSRHAKHNFAKKFKLAAAHPKEQSGASDTMHISSSPSIRLSKRSIADRTCIDEEQLRGQHRTRNPSPPAKLLQSQAGSIINYQNQSRPTPRRTLANTDLCKHEEAARLDDLPGTKWNTRSRIAASSSRRPNDIERPREGGTKQQVQNPSQVIRLPCPSPPPNHKEISSQAEARAKTRPRSPSIDSITSSEHEMQERPPRSRTRAGIDQGYERPGIPYQSLSKLPCVLNAQGQALTTSRELPYCTQTVRPDPAPAKNQRQNGGGSSQNQDSCACKGPTKSHSPWSKPTKQGRQAQTQQEVWKNIFLFSSDPLPSSPALAAPLSPTEVRSGGLRIAPKSTTARLGQKRHLRQEYLPSSTLAQTDRYEVSEEESQDASEEMGSPPLEQRLQRHRTLATTTPDLPLKNPT